MSVAGSALFYCLVAPVTSVSAAQPLDCSKASLAAAVAAVQEKDALITFTGVCAGPIVIQADGVTLEGVGTAIIEGAGEDGVIVAGASRVSLARLQIRNSRNGLAAINGAHLALTDVNVHDNTIFGISLQTASSAVLTNVTISENGLHGLDLQTGSSATVQGTLASNGNAVFGINVNGSSITFAHAVVTASGNVLGIQIATNSNAFINDSGTVINVTNNLATGLTVVSGAQLVSFGGTINASGSLAAGVTVNSKAGLDLDAGSKLNTSANGDGLRIQQDSVMTIFNNPQFSGVPGFSAINASQNTGAGIRVLTGSTLTLVNQAQVVSSQNGQVGLIADNGASATLRNSTLTGNVVRDVQLTFGARADIQGAVVIGTASCDSTVLIRGATFTCPQ